MSRLLLAEELAVLAMRPGTGRRPLANRYALNASMAGLLLAELRLADRPGESPALLAAARVLDESGPKLRAVLSAMDRSLRRSTGRGTWDTATARFTDAELVVEVDVDVDVDVDSLRDQITARLRAAATSAEAIDDVRTALLLSFLGPAKLLELVAPRWRDRRRIRHHIDHLLDGTSFQGLRADVSRVIADQEAVVAVSAAAG